MLRSSGTTMGLHYEDAASRRRRGRPLSTETSYGVRLSLNEASQIRALIAMPTEYKPEHPYSRLPGAPYLDFEMWASSEARPLSPPGCSTRRILAHPAASMKQYPLCAIQAVS